MGMGTLRWLVIVLVFLALSNVVVGFDKQGSNYNFFHFKKNDGLSHNQIHCIMQDSAGFIWIGTNSGLNRFDGNTFKVFKHANSNPKSIKDNNIFNVFEDSQRKLWVRHSQGWDIFEPITESFQNTPQISLNQITIPHERLNTLMSDDKGRDWFCTNYFGLICRVPDRDSVVQLVNDEADTATISSNYVSAIAPDKEGNMWIVTNVGAIEKINVSTFKVAKRIFFNRSKNTTVYYDIFIDREGVIWTHATNYAGGVYSFNPSTEELRHFNTKSANYRLTSDIVTDVIQDIDGMIWISTDHGGLNLFNKHSQSFTYLSPDPFNKASLSANNLVCMYKDRHGTIWIGTFKDGIDCYHKDVFRFNLLKDNPIVPNDLNEDDINCIVEDKSGNFWFGTNGKGLIRYNVDNQRYTYFRHNENDPASICNDIIVTLEVDHLNQLWVGTYFGGMDRFDGQRFHHYSHDPNNPVSLSDNRVFSICEDSNRNLWVGTLGGGLNLKAAGKETFLHYKVDDINSIRSNFIFDILQDKKGNIWFATAIGLSRYVVESNRFIQYSNEEDNPRSLSNNNATTLYIDDKENLWVGTREGLNLFNYETNEFEIFRTENGLPDDFIFSITGDKKGNLWVTTPYNLSKVTLRESNKIPAISVSVYGESDGLQSGEFNVNSVWKRSNGEIYVGGTKGVNYFNPGLNKDVSGNNKIIIAGLMLFNRPVGIGEKVNNRVLLEKSFQHLDKIVLKHNENVFSIEFSDLNYLRSDFSNFYYKLEGFNENWLADEMKNRTAQFTNLNPGNYTFVVRKAKSIDSEEYSEKRIRVIIKPPFWKTQLAYFVYFLFIIGGLLLARQIVLMRERLKMEEEKKEQQENMQREMDVMKMRFFTNISHELKTPLSLILSPIETLLKDTKDDKLYNQYQIIHRNALRLFNMVNQLLDFRKMDAQKLDLTLSEGDLVAFIRSAMESFDEMATKKDIEMIFKSGYPQIFTSFDKRKMERVVFNLLSNAFKFTSAGGKIEVSLQVVERVTLKYPAIAFDDAFDSFIELKVKDNGIGIAPENIERVFERFYQEQNDNGKYNEGSGIGLSIIKEFTHLMGGDVALESVKGEGSTFIVLVPFRINPNEEATVDVDTEEEPEQRFQNEKPTLLIVEDNDDFRAFIKQGFDENYNIVEAADGSEGLKLTYSMLPDLIISDIMMPVMDGIEMCRKIKSDVRTSHIPVILLTAVNNQQKMLDGFEMGADDYITKPFNPEILATRIRNLIEQREKLHKNFKMQMKLTPKDVQVTSLDEKLINKAVEVVEKFIANPDFTVADLSRELGMSRVNLYKKLKSLTGHTPIEFIRAFRIKRAAQLLAQSQMGVSEVAYQVGFNDPRYFTRYFKAEFNMLPSEYAKQHRGKDMHNTLV
jgi:signal transduction histidine kinase/ligand-binding sensor domain-containing protein/DNA-binding response OmpR family regulator